MTCFDKRSAARDVIAKAICETSGGLCDCEPAPRCDYDVEAADAVLAALLSAPESVRLELAEMLLPAEPKPYAQFKAEATARGRGPLNQWQPIETAPKDGRYVLVARANEITSSRMFGRDYWSADTNVWWHSRSCPEGQPTHWLDITLPAPPSEDKP